MKKVRIGGMMHSSGLAMVGVLAMPSRPGIAGKILSTLGNHTINVPFIVQIVDHNGNDHVVFCVRSVDLPAVLDLLEDIRQEVLAKEVLHETNVGTVSIFGPDFRQRPGIAGQMFAALGRAGINIKAISTSMSTITCVIEGSRVRDALAALEETFELPC